MNDAPILYCLHFLGGSASAWAELADALGPAFRCVPIDLPGFGGAAELGARDVAGMAAHVADRVRADLARAPRADGATGTRRWSIAGHSMGAKIACVVARAAEDGASGLEGMSRLVLLAGSPPSPEPIPEDQREKMLGWFTGDPDGFRDQAVSYVGQNVAAPLPDAIGARTVDGVLGMDKPAWRAWLEDGHREDWCDRIGVLRTPALIVAGAEDANLGVDAQRRLMAPHFSACTVETVADAAHLLPLERPGEIARLVGAHLADDLFPASSDPGAIGPEYRALLFSERISTRTRVVLLARLVAPPAGDPDTACFTAAERETARALVARIMPQRTVPAEALARAIEAELASGKGDGWRFDVLPPDRAAWQAGLAALDDAGIAAHGAPFAGCAADAQDAILHRIAAGESSDALPGEPGKKWFEDARSMVTRTYLAHPAVLDRIGYSGIFYGGDGPDKPGFSALGVGRTEDWEPEPRIVADAAAAR